MAVTVRVRVGPADQAAHDRLQHLVEEGISRAGGPPDGLLVHLAHADGDGFVVVEVWRNEAAFEAWWETSMRADLAAAGLRHEAPTVAATWSLARP